MEFIITKENFLNGLQLVSGLASGKNINLPILNNILIRVQMGKIELIATNLEIGISTQLRGKVTKGGEFTTPLKTLIDFITTLPEENVTIKQKDNNLVVTCGSQKGKIRGVSSEDFPLIPKLEQKKSSTIDMDVLVRGFQSVVSAISPNETRPEIAGCFIKFSGQELILASTDSFRLAEKKIKLTTNTHTGQSIIVPLKTVQELIKIITIIQKTNTDNIKEVKIFLSENQILFTIGSTELISRLIEGTYPDYQQIIPPQTPIQATVNKSEFLRAVKSASVFSESGIFDIMIKGKNGRVSLYSSSSQSGEGEASLNAEMQGGEFTLVLNGRYLIDGLGSTTSEHVTLGVVSHESPCVIRPTETKEKDSFLYIIMPIKQ